MASLYFWKEDFFFFLVGFSSITMTSESLSERGLEVVGGGGDFRRFTAVGSISKRLTIVRFLRTGSGSGSGSGSW